MEDALGVIRWLWSGEILDGGRRFRMKGGVAVYPAGVDATAYALAFYNRAATAAARHGDGLGCLGGDHGARFGCEFGGYEASTSLQRFRLPNVRRGGTIDHGIQFVDRCVG